MNRRRAELLWFCLFAGPALLGFVAFNIGRASAMSWVIAIITLVVATPLVAYLLRSARTRVRR